MDDHSELLTSILQDDTSNLELYLQKNPAALNSQFTFRTQNSILKGTLLHFCVDWECFKAFQILLGQPGINLNATGTGEKRIDNWMFGKTPLELAERYYASGENSKKVFIDELRRRKLPSGLSVSTPVVSSAYSSTTGKATTPLPGMVFNGSWGGQADQFHYGGNPYYSGASYGADSGMSHKNEQNDYNEYDNSPDNFYQSGTSQSAEIHSPPEYTSQQKSWHSQQQDQHQDHVLSQQLQELYDEIETQKKEIESKNQQIKKQETEINRLKEKVKQQEDEISTLKHNYNDESRKAKLIADSQKLKDQIDKNKSELSSTSMRQYYAQLQQPQQSNTLQRTKIDYLIKQQKTSELEKVQQHVDFLAKSEIEVKQLIEEEKEIQKAAQQTDPVQQEKQILENKINQLQKENEQYRKEIQEKESLKLEKLTLQSEVVQLRKNITSQPLEANQKLEYQRVTSELETMRQDLNKANELRQFYQNRVSLILEMNSSDMDDFDKFALLGHGAGSAVFQVKLRHDEKDYAMKVIFDWLTTNKESQVRKQYLRECQTLARIPHHPNIISGLGHFVGSLPSNVRPQLQKDFPEYFRLSQHKAMCILFPLGGTTLTTFVDKHLNSISPSIVKHVLLCLLKAVSHIRQNRVVHRDIKWDNVLYDFKSHKLMLIDFGLALQCETDAMTVKLPLGIVTWGNPEYQPPEIRTALRSAELNYSKADMWSAAGVIYDIITIGSVLNLNLAADAPSNTSAVQTHFVPNIPPEFQMFSEFFRKVLEPNYHNRADITQALQLLEAIKLPDIIPATS